MLVIWFSILPSSLSTSFCSFLTVFSAYSARASASFNLEVRVFSCFLNSSTRWLAFSSDTSNDLRELPTTYDTKYNILNPYFHVSLNVDKQYKKTTTIRKNIQVFKTLPLIPPQVLRFWRHQT